MIKTHINKLQTAIPAFVRLTHRVRNDPVYPMRQTRALARSLVKSMRPEQWTKNLFIFGPLLFDEKLFDPLPLALTCIGFVLLCFISGNVYLVNDIVDIEKDRLHPTKKHRPLASGRLPKNMAVAAAIALPFVILPLSFWLNVTFGLIMAAYLLLQIAYSFILKNIVIVDVLAIAAGFVLRVGAGVSLITVRYFSPWLYICTTLLALFLGLGKRRQELTLMGETNNNTRAILDHYSLPFLDQMIGVVTASTVMAYSFYTFSAESLPDNHLMMLTIPFVIYGIFRWLYVIHVQGNGGAPDEVLLQDRPLQLSLALWIAVIVLILYVF